MEKQDRAHPIPLRQWPDGWPKNERALRYLSTKPEFERAFFRVGGTVLVDREKFWEIVRSQGQAA